MKETVIIRFTSNQLNEVIQVQQSAPEALSTCIFSDPGHHHDHEPRDRAGRDAWTSMETNARASKTGEPALGVVPCSAGIRPGPVCWLLVTLSLRIFLHLLSTYLMPEAIRHEGHCEEADRQAPVLGQEPQKQPLARPGLSLLPGHTLSTFSWINSSTPAHAEGQTGMWPRGPETAQSTHSDSNMCFPVPRGPPEGPEEPAERRLAGTRVTFLDLVTGFRNES